MSISRLEDFGTRGITTPEERLKEYRIQCRGLPKKVKAKFWLMVIEKDPEVARLVGVINRKNKRGRRIKGDDRNRDVPLASIEEAVEGVA